MKKFSRKFKRKLKKIKRFLSANDFELLIKHVFNLVKSNLRILKNPMLETSKYSKALRSYVYSVDLGYTIGGVLRDRHYCIVLYTQGKTSVVVPLTSKYNKNIKSVDLGVIQNLSDKNIKSYALINQVTTVSRAMLMKPRKKNKIISVKISDDQMEKLEAGLKDILFKKRLQK